MKQAFEMFLHYDATAYPKPVFVAFTFDMSDSGYALVNRQTVELDIPDDFDPVNAQVTQLKAEREKVSKEFGARLMHIDDQIGKLLSIEHSPSTPDFTTSDGSSPY